jgi:hypothetical protein
MRAPSTFTVTVTETSIPVITKSVYPIPASSDTNEPATRTPPYPSQSSGSVSGSVLPTPPYLNGSGINTPASYTNATTGYVPLSANASGALPNNPSSISPMQAPSGPTANKILGPFENTEGMFNHTSSAGRLQPLRLFAVLPRLILFIDFAKAQVTGEASQHIEPRFYPYPAPLNSGPPPHLSDTPRDVAPTISESQILGTLTTTSTITFTMTDVHSPTGPLNFSLPSIVVMSSASVEVSSLTSSSLLQEANTSSPSLSLFATVSTGIVPSIVMSTSNSTVIPPSTSEVNDTNSGSYTPWWSSVHNATVSVTVTEPASPTSITTTMTLTFNVTNTIEKPTTHTTTLIRTTGLFNAGATPTAAGVVEELNFFLYYVVIATWVVLFAMT